MHYLRTIGTCLCMALCMTSMQAQTKWYNPVESKVFPLQGRAWSNETGKTYQRLPPRAEQSVRKAVWNLSQAGAGLYIKFRTNATDIQVKYHVTGSLSMPHMPATGVSGIDLYATDADGNQYWCAGQYAFGDTIRYHYRELTYRNPHGKGNEYCLYLPLYNHVDRLEIGVPEQSQFRFMQPDSEKPVVIYGTSIAQGACASRPGMAWTNILQRKLDMPVVNLGFSGNGQLEAELFQLLAETDASLYVIDCMPNMTGQRVKLIQERIKEGIRIIREKSKAPILLVEHDGYMGYHTSEAKLRDFQTTNRELRAAYEDMKGHTGELYYLSFDELGLDMDSQVDGIHATDWGMQQYACAYMDKITEILHLDRKPFVPRRQHRDAGTYDWNMRHNEVLAYNRKEQPEIVLIGNSITHYWGGLPYEKKRVSDDTWQRLFQGKRTVNMGFGWDRIENILWRLEHGELDGFRARKIFMMAGTNNLSLNSDAEIAAGIRQLARIIRRKQPDAQLYIVKILPRKGQLERLKKLNSLIEQEIKKDKTGTVIDLSDHLLNADGSLNDSLFSDGLHPNSKGYRLLSEKLKPYI